MAEWLALWSADQVVWIGTLSSVAVWCSSAKQLTYTTCSSRKYSHQFHGTELVCLPTRHLARWVSRHPVDGKVCIRAKVAHQAGAYPGFRGMKRLGIFLLPPGWDASPSQGYPQH